MKKGQKVSWKSTEGGEGRYYGICLADSADQGVLVAVPSFANDKVYDVLYIDVSLLTKEA